VAVGFLGSIISSPDGISWTVRNSGITETLSYINYVNGLFIALSRSSDIVLSSSDAKAWTVSRTGQKQKLHSVTYGNNQFVCVGDKSTIVTSPDAVTWTARASNLPESNFLYAVAYGNNQFVAAGSRGSLLTSTDAKEWTFRNFPDPLTTIRVLTFHNGSFFAMGQKCRILSSTDGITWTNIDWANAAGLSLGNPYSSIPTSVAKGNDMFVAIIKNNSANSIPRSILYSPDGGTTWAPESLETGRFAESVAFGGTAGKFVIVGLYGTIIHSNTIKTPVRDLNLKNSEHPVSGYFNIYRNRISVSIGEKGTQYIPEKVQVSLFSCTGRQIFSKIIKTTNGKMTIVFPGFPGGNYYLSIKRSNTKPVTYPVTILGNN
jgi:photosystem II stability/assembly factor-like uncharacterized protein